MKRYVPAFGRVMMLGLLIAALSMVAGAEAQIQGGFTQPAPVATDVPQQSSGDAGQLDGAPELIPTGDTFKEATNTVLTPARENNIMTKSKQCIKEQWSTGPVVPCCEICCRRGRCWCCVEGNWYRIAYWEPSAIIEVSCRTGYSMIAPGSVPARGGGLPEVQSCQGFNKPGNSRWFFEARVWAINGAPGGLRHKAMGGTEGERTRKCTLQAGDDLPWGLPGNIVNGYGVKWLQFSRGAANGPSGSWEAYMSDKDPLWATNGGSQRTPKECTIGSTDLENCWGPTIRSGWVSHPNPRVAAALVAWRAHTQAKGRVSPAGKGGYKMAFEYPWITYTGEHGASMGMPGGGGKQGSGCFEPGDSGPEWFGGQKPEAIPDLIANLEKGDMTSVVEVNPGTYIFTVWVHTSCLRYTTSTGRPTAICHYKQGT